MAKSNPVQKASGKNTSQILCAGPFTLDLKNMHVLMNETELDFPPCTFSYLVTLVRNAPHPVSYQDLVLQSQGFHLGRLEAQDLARSRIYLLRKSIEQDTQEPQHILAVAGYGYRLVL